MRLIDADALIKALTRKAKDASDAMRVMLIECVEEVKQASTINLDPCDVCKWKDEYPWDQCEKCEMCNAEGIE